MAAKEIARELQLWFKLSRDLASDLLHGRLADANGWLLSIGFLRLSPVEIPILKDGRPPQNLTVEICFAYGVDPSILIAGGRLEGEIGLADLWK
jgi:hypothetical protein